MIILLRVLNKDICVSVLKDILVALNKNSLAILRLLKKKSIINEIKNLSNQTQGNNAIPITEETYQKNGVLFKS